MIDSAATAELRSALTRADARPALFTIKAADGTIYIAALLPVRATGPFALVINQQPPDNPAIGNALMQAFALTPRELTVLLALLKSPSIESAAAELGIEIPTARSHLHRIFAKTGTGRQAELVQKIQGALPPIAPKP
jgi:DNA-binding CsgD family transcriptional regulator